MKPIKLIIRTKTEKYPVLIGRNLVENLSNLFSQNSINSKKYLLIIDKKYQTKLFLKLQNPLKASKYIYIYLSLVKKIRIKKVSIKY